MVGRSIMSSAAKGPAPIRRNATTTGAAAEDRSEILGQGADVRSLRAQDLDFDSVAFDAPHIETMNGDPTRLASPPTMPSCASW